MNQMAFNAIFLWHQGWQVSVPVETETGNLVSELAMGRDRDQVKMYTI